MLWKREEAEKSREAGEREEKRLFFLSANALTRKKRKPQRQQQQDRSLNQRKKKRDLFFSISKVASSPPLSAPLNSVSLRMRYQENEENKIKNKKARKNSPHRRGTASWPPSWPSCGASWRHRWPTGRRRPTRECGATPSRQRQTSSKALFRLFFGCVQGSKLFLLVPVPGRNAGPSAVDLSNIAVEE